MSNNRHQYSSSPLNNLNHNSRGGFQMPERSKRERSQRSFVFLQIMMTLILPVLFIVALIVGYREVHCAFLILAALSLLIMWLLRAFVSNARTTMTLIYAALMLVSLGAVLFFAPSYFAQEETTGTKVDYSTLFGRNTTASDVNAVSTGNATQIPASSAYVTPTPDSRSDAQERLEEFMNCWMSLDYNGMLSCCKPTWVSSQEDPQRSIFSIRGTNTPLSFQITYVAGSDSNDSRTISMTVLMDRGTGKETTYQYEVLMLRVNGVWYVDPASLSSATEIKTTATVTPSYTLMPTNTPNPDQVLYYNPNGGSYYHKDANCSKVSSKYLPLKGSFTYSQLNESAYADLIPCTGCNAPGR